MDIEQLLENFQYEDLQWLLPVLAGLVIILGGLLIGIVRGMSSGIVVALFLGSLMSMSPVLLDALERQQAGASTVHGDVVRGTAELSVLTSEQLQDLSGVVNSLRVAVARLSTPAAGGGDPADAGQVSESLQETEDRLDAALGTLERASALRQRVESTMTRMDADPSRGPDANR